MTEEPTMQRLLLCAEMSHRGRRIRSHTLQLADSLVCVHTDAEAFIGDQIMLTLSFPGLVAPLVIETQMIAQQVGGTPGRYSGWVLGFVLYSAAQQQRLRQLLRGFAPQPGADESGAPDSLPRDRPYRVLLLDDNDLTRQTFSFAGRKLFGSTGQSVILDIVSEPREAWKQAHEQTYDLALIDQFLTATTGDRLIKQLRADPETADLPIFAVSMGGTDARDATLAAGADLFVPKPLVVRNLFHTLHHLTRRDSPTTSLRRSAG